MINISTQKSLAGVGDRDLTGRTGNSFQKKKYLLLVHMISWQGRKRYFIKKGIKILATSLILNWEQLLKSIAFYLSQLVSEKVLAAAFSRQRAGRILNIISCIKQLFTAWQIDGETVETVADFIFGGSKITVILDGDCSHEIKRRLLLGRKAMTNLNSLLESRNMTLSTKVCLVKGVGEDS